MHTRPDFSASFRRHTLPLALAAMGAAASLHAHDVFASPAFAQPATQDTVVPASPAINAAWRSWRAALDARSSFLDPKELAAKLEQYKAWLVALDAGLPASKLAAAGATGWFAALAAEGREQRESAIRRILARIEPQAPALDDPAVQAEIESARRSLAAWQSRASLLTDDLITIERSLSEARTLEEGGPNSIRTLAEKWTHEGLTRQPGVRAAVAPVLDRVDSLEKLERETSTAELLRVARDATAQKPELLFAAWRRLSNRGQSAWPSTEDDLAAEVAIRPVLLRAAGAVADPDRAQTLKDEVAMEQSRRLTRLLSAAIDDSTLAAADTALRDLGLSEKVLDGRIRYNLLLNRLKRAVSAPGITDERARAHTRDFLTAVRDLQGGIAFLSGANTVVAALDAIAGGLELSPATVEPGRFGPAAAGLGSGVEDGTTLTFSLPARSGAPESKLVFVLVGEGVAASYITIHEVTVGQVAAIVAARKAEQSLSTVLPVFRPLEDSRRGPRTWTWRRDDFDVPQICPSPSWFSSVAVLGGANYPADSAPAPPTADSPMQQIPAAAAAYIASLAGCRIPTIGEWTALRNEHAPEVRRELSNLRDARWKALNDHMLARKVSGRWAEIPDSGIFRPVNAPITDSGTSHPWDDGWLWFANAASPESTTSSHVLGNVAEFATTNPWVLPAGPDATAAFVAKSMAQLRVVGGSALSDPSIDPLVPQELDPIDALEGFSDVGFRLAFGADAVARPDQQAGLQVIEVLSPTPYLKQR